MLQNKGILKKFSLILGVTTLLLGLLPAAVFGQASMVSAVDNDLLKKKTEEPAAEDPSVEEPLVEEPVVEDPPVEDPQVEEPLAEEPLTEEPLAEEPVADEPLVEEPLLEEPLVPEEEFSDESGFAPMFAMMAIGDDPVIENDIPVPGTYNNGLCNSNPLYCVDAEPVTNPNDYTDEGTYGRKTYDIPEINGILAEILVVKSGDDYLFFKNGSGATCFEDTFCVEFDGTKVHIYSYETQANGYKGYNLINFWVTGLPEGSNPGCTDRLANNFNPDANLDDGSCDYDDPGDGGGGSGGSGGSGGGSTPVLIPVTGVDLESGFSLYRVLMLMAGSSLLTSGLFMKGSTKKEKKQRG